MRSSIAARVFSVLSVLAISLLVVTALTGIRISVARAQDNAARTQNKAKVTFTIDPSPAQKGPNTVRVKLTDETGQPISGADVAVTFFMPAMPSMNMAEMKTTIKCAEKGRGMYEGKSELGSVGIWQVSITAKQNGRTIAIKKLTVKAAGGA